MANRGEVLESRSQVVECFLTRRSRASLEGGVYTDGSTLCVVDQHVAFWHQGIIYLVELDSPGPISLWAQACIRVGNHGHLVAEGVSSNGTDQD
jgi:hypothetical protein